MVHFELGQTAAMSAAPEERMGARMSISANVVGQVAHLLGGPDSQQPSIGV